MKTLDEKIAHLKIQLAYDDPSKPEDQRLLTDWERGFIESVAESVEFRGVLNLSNKQKSRLHEIYDKYFDA